MRAVLSDVRRLAPGVHGADTRTARQPASFICMHCRARGSRWVHTLSQAVCAQRVHPCAPSGLSRARTRPIAVAFFGWRVHDFLFFKKQFYFFSFCGTTTSGVVTLRGWGGD